MQNNVGIYASQISGHLWAPNGSYDALATVTVPSGGVASVSFAGIPQGYKHLQIRAISRIVSASEINLLIKFNSDAGNNYTGHYLYGDGSSAVSGVLALNITPPFAIRTSNSNATSGVFGSSVTDILDYTNTSKYKTVRNFSGLDNNGSGSVFMVSDLWMNTSAINEISLYSTGSNIAEYSSFALYGIK